MGDLTLATPRCANCRRGAVTGLIAYNERLGLADQLYACEHWQRREVEWKDLRGQLMGSSQWCPEHLERA